jgi:hypothetical protein
MLSIKQINNIQYLKDDIYEYFKISNCKNYIFDDYGND